MMLKDAMEIDSDMGLSLVSPAPVVWRSQVAFYRTMIDILGYPVALGGATYDLGHARFCVGD